MPLGPCPIHPKGQHGDKGTQDIELWGGLGLRSSNLTSPREARGCGSHFRVCTPVTPRRSEGGGVFIHRPPSVTTPAGVHPDGAGLADQMNSLVCMLICVTFSKPLTALDLCLCFCKERVTVAPLGTRDCFAPGLPSPHLWWPQPCLASSTP